MVNHAHAEPTRSPAALIDEALTDLERVIVLTAAPGPASHTVLIADGIEKPAAVRALGRYLTGVVAGIVGLDARITDELLQDWTDGPAELAADLQALLGADNVFDTEKQQKFKTTARDPWIAEGIGHALLVIRARASTNLLPGAVHAVKKLHPRPNIPGIDLLAIYDDGDDIAVTIGECKASSKHATNNLASAAKFFKEVDAGDYGYILREEIAALRPVLPEPIKPQVTNALWRRSRCYVPAIAYAEDFDPHCERAHLAALVPPPDRRRLVAVELSDFHGFFDAVADAMRTAVTEVTL
ncbi:hypothetical protein GCM10027447_01760 [Glycomyces halotolerans]